MKKFTCYLIIFLIFGIASAQTQKGNLHLRAILKDSSIREGHLVLENDTLFILQAPKGMLSNLLKSDVLSWNYIPVQREQAFAAEIIFKDGTSLHGVILEQHEKTLLFLSELTGEKMISRDKLLSIKPIRNTTSGNNQVYINIDSRYFYSPSALGMKKGDGYYQNTYVLLNSFNYAFTDHFSFGFGTEAISFLGGRPIFLLQGKVSVPLTQILHAGVGFLHFNFIMMDPNTKAFNMGFATLTVGTPKAHISFNYGEDLRSNGDVATVSGFLRVSPKLGIITENWILINEPDEKAEKTLNSLGFRVIGRKNLFDFGLIYKESAVRSGLIGIPYLSYTLRF